MDTQQVETYFQSLIQESDQSFLSYAFQSQLLAQGYNEFRSKVNSYDKNFYATNVTISPTGTSYDLADPLNPVRLYGATPTHARMSQLVSLADPDQGGTYSGYPWQGVSSRRALLNAGDADNYRKYFLQGTVLYFPSNAPTVVVRYIPVSTLTWAVPAAANVFIDDLVEFHELISLYAGRRYYAIDASTNSRFDLEIGIREAALETFMTQKRLMDASEIQREVGIYFG
jgi:hypothetical protein